MRTLRAQLPAAAFAALSLLVVLPLLLIAPAPARATVCSTDRAPAATLLLPYFEVDLDLANGRTTLFSINNASSSAILTNVTFWSDLGVPTLWFHLYLTGYDVQTVNLRDIFNGIFPRTASAGQDPSDTISPQGDASQDLNFSSCTGTLPLPALPGAFIDHLRKSHTGKASAVLRGLCAGRDRGDNVARGYVTVDTINACILRNPSEPNYFGPGGLATNQNVLWGDFFLVDEANNYAQGEDLIRLEANPGRFRTGEPTFYGRYVGHSGVDAREPLPSKWASRYVVAGAFTGGTDLLVWRESGRKTEPFGCGTTPAGFPLRWYELATYDEQENVETFDIGLGDPPAPGEDRLELQFGGETNRVKIDGPEYPVTADYGWIFLNLGGLPGTSLIDREQAWVGTISSADGRFSVGYNATPLDSMCAPR